MFCVPVSDFASLATIPIIITCSADRLKLAQ